MTVEIKAPAFPESVADGVVSAWHKGPGDSVARDELLVEIETDKVVMEVVAPEPGVIEAIMVAEGETITSEAVLATLTAGAAVTQAPAAEVFDIGEAALAPRRHSLKPSRWAPPFGRCWMSMVSPGEYRRDGQGRPTAQRGRAVPSEAGARATCA
ncbi:MAG: hypothetical protein CM15mP125_2380 [Gammaproteobacteria bacterium]|nr:MAG: hypothetical protein CM15mP125_2380 [Gammaproteobacteria bacterium]